MRQMISTESRWYEVARVIESAFLAGDSAPIEEALSRWLKVDRPWRIEIISPDKPKLVWRYVWRVSNETVLFSFNHGDFERSSQLLERWIKCLPLFADIVRRNPGAAGATAVQWGDSANAKGLGFCSCASAVSLMPDSEFIAFRGHRDFRAAIAAGRSWEAREPVAIWRGTIWSKVVPGGWSKQLRTELCRLATRPEARGLLDAGATEGRPTDHEEVAAAGLIRPAINAEELGHFKYHIDIDGYSNAWSGLFRKLYSGGVVIKVCSPYRQWYYGRLVPWGNYVPAAPDLSDLLDKIRWLKAHDDDAKRIGEGGRQLANSMTYEVELELIEPVILTSLEQGRQKVEL